MFVLPPLPYEYNALEPHIDAKTMEIHYAKHHQGYVNKLNIALEGTEFLKMSVQEVIKNIEKIPKDKLKAVINNGGGHANHSLFWEIMTPEKERKEKPEGELMQKIEEKFESFKEFKNKFDESAKGIFGSGWAWLVVDSEGNLDITTTSNQDNPLMKSFKPILGLDVWEHAYYLKHQNRRPEYIESWWNVVNWKKVEELFNQSKEI